MWKIFRQSKTQGLGLDISKTRIKIAQLLPQPNQPPTYRIIQAPVASNSKKTQKENTVFAIKQLTKQLDNTYKEYSIAISDNSAFSLLFSLDEKKFGTKEAALLYAAPFLTVPLDTLYFDFQVIKKTKNSQQLFIVFCKKEVIHQQKQLIQSSELHLAAIELKSHSLERGYRYLHDLEKYPDCWASALVDEDTLIVLLWDKEQVIQSFSDKIEALDSIEAITTQLYQQLVRLLGIHSPKALKALWVIGDHPFCEAIQKESRKAFLLPQNLVSSYRHTKNTPLKKDWRPFYVALGLALRNL